MLICHDLFIPANTPSSNPVKEAVKCPEGVICKVWVTIPAGHRALAHMVIRHGETQIIPWEGDIHGDDDRLVFEENYKLETEDYLVLEGWNEDSVYPHRFIVRLLILPEEYAYPGIQFISLLEEMMEVMGLVPARKRRRSRRTS